MGVVLIIPGIAGDFSELSLTKRQIRVLGAVLTLFGLLEFTASYFIASAITTHQANAAAQLVEQTNECKDRLHDLGFNSTVTGKKISAEMTGLDDAAYKLGQATLAALSCPGWRLSRFCMGEGCGAKGEVSFELQPVDFSN